MCVCVCVCVCVLQVYICVYNACNVHMYIRQNDYNYLFYFRIAFGQLRLQPPQLMELRMTQPMVDRCIQVLCVCVCVCVEKNLLSTYLP